MKTAHALWLLALACGPVCAESLPKWELGLGLGVMTVPDYRGADEYQTFVLPVPRIIYRGERLRADREGVRSRLFGSERLQLDLSLSGGVPVKSGDNAAREGMPDLKPTLELGPQLVAQLAGSWQQGYRLMARWPVRKVFALGSNRDAGWVMTPTLSLDGFDLPTTGWRMALSGGPYWGNRAANAYYYDVSDDEARPDRPAYHSRSGYGGAQLTFTLSRQTGRFWLGAFLRASTVRRCAGSSAANPAASRRPVRAR